MFSGHDWRQAIGPRDGFFMRCRRCYATELVEEPVQPQRSVSASSKRTA
jgi:hypothetical protein